MAEFKLGRLKFVWRGDWTNSHPYVKDDVIKYGGRVYVCVGGHTSDSDLDQGFYDDSSYWEMMVDGTAFREAWTATTAYNENDIVTYGGTVYVCNTNHISASLLETNQAYWTEYTKGFDWKGTYTNGPTHYKVNDLVRWGANVYVCTTQYTTSTATLDPTKFALFVSGLEFENSYSAANTYQTGDLVTYGGYVYIAIQDQAPASPHTPAPGSAWWNVLTTGYNNRGEYSGATAYKTGDVVRYGGNTYEAILDTTGNTPVDTGYWKLLAEGLKFRSTWVAATVYKLNDVVSYGSSTYVCIQQHTANASTNRPDVDITNVFWNVLAEGDSNYVLTTRGDLLTRGSAANVRLGIGNDGTVLRSNGTDASWQYYGIIPNVYYVAPTGTDDPAYGNSVDKPWRTIRYACSRVNLGTGFTNSSTLIDLNQSWMVREMYQWMIYQKSISASPFSPGSVFDQAKTLRDAQYLVEAVQTDLIRGSNAQTVNATLAYFKTSTSFYNTATTLAMPYIIAAIGKLKDLMINAVTNAAPAFNYQTLTSYTPAISQTINLAYTAEANTTTTITNLFSIITTALTAGSTSSVPIATTGSTSTIFVKTGTYAEILPISIPENTAVVGDELRGTIIEPAAGYTASNMFYMRNGTGLRNCTLRGLYGGFTSTLPSGTKRTSGGSYVSLDPGTDPDDASVWIRNKSPYVQNVSTFGYGVTGVKVDGSLHNGGNKSIVANDFTQVISDGIGAWALNLGRMELVSVFTYYCYMGYLTELGGTIRATNGNNSYGTYGSVSEGVDPTETPATANVNNYASGALVDNVLVGGGQIIRVEYSHAGQSYSTAAIGFSGNGAGAAATLATFSTQGVTRVKVNSGGSGYQSVTNNAQSGDTTSIRLATSDSMVTSGYNGMRIVIIDGTGFGQTGIISAYNGGTKTATIVDEVGASGWDSIQGVSIASALDSTTRYTIEPRIQFSGGSPSRAATARVVVTAGAITGIRIIDCGSAYGATPAIIITDPNSISAASFTTTLADGVLNPPSFSNRGSGYTSSSAVVSGNGFANIEQVGGYVNVANLAASPKAGSNLVLASDPSTYYRIVAVTNLTLVGATYTARLQISPYISSAAPPAHNTAITIYERYSNVRLTGHDFLNIGYGNLAEANYPGITSNALIQANEVVEYGGGRVFYTSTDQDGNFRVGELFRVEQATGIATLNADAFNLSGLTSLQLGSVALGGTGAVISEFSTDPTFVANSDSILPTQRAIKSFVTNLVGGGGSALVATSIELGDMFLTGQTITSLHSKDLIIAANSTYEVSFTSRPKTTLAPLTDYHLANKLYVDTTARPTVHALQWAQETGEMTYVTETGTSAATVTVNQQKNDSAFVSTTTASVSLNSSGHMIINL